MHIERTSSKPSPINIEEIPALEVLISSYSIFALNKHITKIHILL